MTLTVTPTATPTARHAYRHTHRDTHRDTYATLRRSATRRQAIARTLLHTVGGKNSLEHTAPELHAELPEKVKGGDTKPLEDEIRQLGKRLKDRDDSLADARHKQADAENARDLVQTEVSTARVTVGMAACVTVGITACIPVGTMAHVTVGMTACVTGGVTAPPD